MSDDRLARALLRLYPRTWRARYGDELLALIADTGLTWRAAIDVVGAASVERARVLIALWRGQAEADAFVTTKTWGPANFRELITEGGAVVCLMCVTWLSLIQLGVQKPWANTSSLPLLFSLLAQGALLDLLVPRPASPIDRVLLRFFPFALGIGVAGLAWACGGLLIRVGVPVPPWPLAPMFGCVVFLAGTLRITYRRWPENRVLALHPAGSGEVRLWGLCLFLAAVAVSMLEEWSNSFLAVAFLAYQWVQLAKLRRNTARLAGYGPGQNLPS